MANAKEIKERMASIQETKKITNAMYLISSSKMKQAKKKLADTEPFFYAMQAEIGTAIFLICVKRLPRRTVRSAVLLLRPIRAWQGHTIIM